MIYVERKPDAALAGFIECLWVARDIRARQQRTADRILPDGCPEWIVHAGDAFERQIDGRWVRQPRSFLAGTLTRPWLVRGGRRVRTLGIRFKPGAAASLLGIDLTGTADREVDLSRLLQADAATLVAAVCNARTSLQMLNAAHAQLLELVASRLTHVPRTRQAVQRLTKSHGRARVDALARSLAVSRRTLERLFQRELGISPKRYARIVRFNAVLASVAAAERHRVIDLALAAGYFDEAHMLKDFRSLAGRKPHSRPETDGELARYFTRPNRLRTLLEQRD